MRLKVGMIFSSWVTTMIAVWNSCARRLRIFTTASARSLSSGAVGSSARMIGGLLAKRARDRHALLLAAGQLGDARLRAVLHVEGGQHVQRDRARLGVRHAGQHRQQRDVVGGVEKRDEVGRLEHEADAVAAQRAQVGASSSRCRRSPRRPRVKRPGGRLDHRAQAFQQGGLAGAGRTDQPHHLARDRPSCRRPSARPRRSRRCRSAW